MDQELDAGTAPDAMSQMVFVDVVLVLPATHPVVVLQEADAPFRELRIPVGGAEGIAISYAGRDSRPRGRSPTSCSPVSSRSSG